MIYSERHYALAADLLPHLQEKVARVPWHELERSLERHAHGRIPLACADTRRELAVAREVGLLAEDEVEQEACNAELEKDIAEALSSLTPREQTVIRLRFGFDGVGCTLEQVGNYLGLQKERIRQIEAKALSKLRHVTRAARLRPHIAWGAQ